MAREQPARRLRLDQRLRQRPGRGRAARLRPDRAGHLRVHEPDRRHRRRALPGGGRAVRRHGRAARDDRRAVRAQPPARDRRGPAHRGEPAVLGAVGAGQPDQRVRRRRRRPVPDGQQPPEPVPVRAAAVRRRGADRHRGQRRPVPPARARCSACPSWPTTRGSCATRTAPPTATRSARCWWSGCAPGPSSTGSATSSPRACRAGRSTPSTRAWRSPRRSGWTRWSPWGRGRPPSPRCATRSPSRPPRPSTGCRRRPSISTARRSAAGWPTGAIRVTADGLSFPTSLGTSTADEIRLLGQDLTADLMGKVGFGELAFWLVAMRRPTPSETRVFEAVLVALADHGFTPTAIAARLTYLSAPDSLQGALAAGLLGGGSRFLGVTEDCGTVPARRPRPRGRRTADRRRGLGRARPRGGHGRPGRRAGSSPGWGTRCTRSRRPADAGADRHRRGGGPARPAPAAVRGDRPGARAGAGPPAAAQRGRRLRRGAGRPRAAGRAAARASRCSPGRPGCSASSPRSAAVRSAWTPTWPSTATRSTSTPTAD